MTEPLELIGYLRVSTDEQLNGYGLDAQRAQLQAAEGARWTLQRVLTDEGLSAKTLHRPMLYAALELIADGAADGLVVSKLDRLTRSLIDFATLLDWFDAAGATLIALDLNVDTSTPSGRLVANVMASVAQWERETIGQRTRDGLAAKRASGEAISRPAIADDLELAAQIRAWSAEGWSLRQICQVLDSLGVPTSRGAVRWRPSALQVILGYKPPRRPRGATLLPELRR